MLNPPIFVGMSNPHSQDARDVLAPWPAGTAGHRLWLMFREATGRSLNDYLDTERINLCVSVWDRAEAGRTVKRLKEYGRLDNRVVVVLGREVAQAFNLGKMEPTSGKLVGTTHFLYLPHPSGRCIWYNKNRWQAVEILRRIFQ